MKSEHLVTVSSNIVTRVLYFLDGTIERIHGT